ncbi:MAG: lamin tail domain-containing protein, partial [Myxococcaceae bacterium]|nr:lamin tail domain-containing protein [Myxococcaceae bacterium]
TATTNTPAQSVSSDLRSFVRDGPFITSFVVPTFGTELKPATVRWTAMNGYRSEILLDGAPVFTTTPPASANGSFTIPALNADVAVTLVVHDFNGLQARLTRTIKVARPPKVNTFTLPMAVGAGGTPAMATWTTSNATSVIVRVKSGPIVYETQVLPMVNAGMTSLRPSSTTTYVVEAYNGAGDKDSLERTITVNTGLYALANPNPVGPGAPVELTWDLSTLAPAEIIGIPQEPPVSTSGVTTFVDIHGNPNAVPVIFSSTNDGTVSFTVPQGFTAPFAGAPTSTFSVSTNGWLALGTTTSTVAANVDFKGTSGLPAFAMIAPYWDDLDLGTAGTVDWLVEGTTFPRKLTVQWANARLVADPMSQLTFQVQIFETGEVRFLYQTLTITAQGNAATVGIFLGAGVFRGQHSFNTPSLYDGLQLTWFTNGAAVGTRSFTSGTANVAPGFYYKTDLEQYGWVAFPVRVVTTNYVIVNEVMPIPTPGIFDGTYVELFNPTQADLDVSGLELVTATGPNMPFVIPAGTVIPDSGYLVIGASTDFGENGGAAIDISYGTTLAYAAEDAVSVRVGQISLSDGGTFNPFIVNTLSWDAGEPGYSIQREGGAVLGAVPRCTRTQTYGMVPTISTGTPRALNESCFPYTVAPIPVDFEDVTSVPDAGPLMPSSWDTSLVTVQLPVPFTYFGADAGSTMKVAANGFLTFRAAETNGTDTNKTFPSTSTPFGTIAVFWDDLGPYNPVGASVSNAFVARSGNKTIVQWNKVSLWASRDTGSLDFEAKLFDDGTIEFHYGDLNDTSGSALDAGTPFGGGATGWLEAPNGTSALPLFVNQPRLQPNTAYRFTPKQ